jgi:hypothetical protein
MKILIGSVEICGWIALFQKEFKNLGFDCTSIIEQRNFFFQNESYSLVLEDKYIKETKSNTLNKIIRKTNKVIRLFFLFYYVYNPPKKYDLVVYLWNTFDVNHIDVTYLVKKGSKTIFLFAGSEIRSFIHFSKEYNVTEWSFPVSWYQENVSAKKNYISIAENNSKNIYSVPDQAGLQKKPYYHFQIPIDIKKYKFVNNRRKVPKVLHLPSDPWKKGSDIIEQIINELIQENIPINFLSLRNIPNEEVIPLLSDVDILVDEIVFHGPGVLAFEAMASGCVVATRYIENSPICFKPPICNIDAQNIKQKLKDLFLDYDLQQKLIIEGRKYIEQNNNSMLVIKSMINNLTNPKEPDYFPLNSMSL